MQFESYEPVITKDDSRQLWNVKFFDRDGRPRNVSCVNEEEAAKISQLVRTAGDLVLTPFQIMRVELTSGKREYATTGHVDKSLFVALVNFEYEAQFHPDDAQHTYLRESGMSQSGAHIAFEQCKPDDARAFAATLVAQ